MSAHKPLHLFEAKAADTRISKDEPAVARLNFSLANGEVLVVKGSSIRAGTPTRASKAGHRSSAASRPRPFSRPFGPFPE
jgi:hypothetical protein